MLPLPKHNAEAIAAARERRDCPIRSEDWYRMPRLFNMAHAIFGDPWMNDRGGRRSSRHQVGLFVHMFCRAMRDKFPTTDPCPLNRQDTCRRIIQEAFTTTLDNRPAKPLPYLKVTLQNTVNSERVTAAMRALEARRPTIPTFSLFRKEAA